MYLSLHDFSAEYSLITVVILYSASLTVSTSFQNTLTSKESCNPLILFGECFFGENEARFEVHPNNYLQHSISFVITLLVGVWSDSHGRRRKPLIVLPILGQILTDGLYFVKIFWYWPSYLDIIFTSVIPGLYVGRNMFCIGVISYVSENSSIELRTLKLGIIIATYTIGSSIGAGVVALIKSATRYYYYNYVLFVVPILINLIAALVGLLLVKDISDSYNKNIVWLRPKCLLKSFTAILKNKSKSFAAVLVILVICQSVFVARIGCDYALIMQHIKHSFTWYDEGYVHFNLFKMIALFSGSVSSVYLFSHKMEINDIVIGIFICSFYIFAAVCYVVTIPFWQTFILTIIYLCHGSAVIITTSLTSKMVEIEELGRLNSIQTSMNFVLTIGMFMAFEVAGDGYYHFTEFGHYCMVILLYVVLTLPILCVFMVLYFKFKDYWTKETTTTINNSVYIISH